MSRFSKLLIPALALILLGQGCFGGSKIDSTSDGGVFKTGDAGDTWKQVNVIPSAQGIGTISGVDVRTMEIDPSDKSVMYIGTLDNGLLYTEDTAASWQQPRLSALKEGPINDIEVDPSNTCAVYVAKQSRLYKTTDCLRTFDSEVYVETRSSVFVRRVAVDWFNPSVLWIGLSNGDLLKSEDGGDTWKKKLAVKSPIVEIVINQQDSRNILIATEEDGFQRTADSGETWEEINEGLKSLRKADQVNAVVQTKNSDTLLAATAYGLLRSNDFGTTWEAIQLLTSAGQVSIITLAMAPENADRIYYSANATFYASDDGGDTWTTYRIPTSRIPTAMIIDPDEPSVLYVGVVAATP